MAMYIQRKKYPYDWSVLIPTIPGREEKLRSLIASIREKVLRIAPEIRIDINIDFDNRESSIGVKRQRLLQNAVGKYSSFIDDDDDITDAYIEDLQAMMKGGFHTMRLRGVMREYQFVHSTAVKLTDPMATKDNPPILQRPPNHLNPMLSDIAKFIPFKNATYGEDLDWTINLCRAGLLRSEYTATDALRIHYMYNIGDRFMSPDIIPMQQTMDYQTMSGLIFTSADRSPPSSSQAVGSALRLTARGFVSR